MSSVQRYGSGGPWENKYGAWVSGCTATLDGVVQGNGDPYGQTKLAFANAEKALQEAGFTLGDVVRTRWFVVHARDIAEVGRAHGEVFVDVRPAASVYVISGLIEPGMLVEVEVEAYRVAGAVGASDTPEGTA